MATVTEPTTGISFPTAQAIFGNDYVSLGAGPRVRKIAMMSVKVYAAVLYVDAFKASEIKTQNGAKDDALGLAIIDSNFSKALQLQFARDIESSKLAKGFDDMLRPKLLDDLASLDQFCSFFISKTITCGSNFILLWNVDTGSLEVSCSESGPFADADRAQPELVVASTKLCRALYDLHLGRDAITPALRKSVLEGARKL